VLNLVESRQRLKAGIFSSLLRILSGILPQILAVFSALKSKTTNGGIIFVVNELSAGVAIIHEKVSYLPI
jgi:hypothetical protein